MGINIKILNRIKKMECNEETKDFLNVLLALESDEIGHYKKKYRELLEMYLEKGVLDENN
jgi:hypothetical protein